MSIFCKSLQRALWIRLNDTGAMIITIRLLIVLPTEDK